MNNGTGFEIVEVHEEVVWGGRHRFPEEHEEGIFGSALVALGYPPFPAAAAATVQLLFGRCPQLLLRRPRHRALVPRRPVQRGRRRLRTHGNLYLIVVGVLLSSVGFRNDPPGGFPYGAAETVRVLPLSRFYLFALVWVLMD